MNLAGKTLVLENTDALGVNSRRAYKNVPFFVSSRGYGLLVLTSAHVRLSLADISTRAAQALWRTTSSTSSSSGVGAWKESFGTTGGSRATRAPSLLVLWDLDEPHDLLQRRGDARGGEEAP